MGKTGKRDEEEREGGNVRGPEKEGERETRQRRGGRGKMKEKGREGEKNGKG